MSKLTFGMNICIFCLNSLAHVSTFRCALTYSKVIPQSICSMLGYSQLKPAGRHNKFIVC